MEFRHEFTFSNNFKSLFNKKCYESFVLKLMNKSQMVFPDLYEMITEQSDGQCDFINCVTHEKYDAKLPFLSDQIKMLVKYNDHDPQIEEWIEELRNEASEFSPLRIRDDPQYTVQQTKLYTIMRDQISKDKLDENIIFFMPFPIVISIRNSIFLQFAADYLSAIYDCLKDDPNIDLSERSVYVIYPSDEENTFVLRNLSNNAREFIHDDGLSEFFIHEIANVKI